MLKHTILKPSRIADTLYAGRYRFVVREASTGDIVRETDWIDNIITDIGLNRAGTGNLFGWAHIGTGTSTPATTDTGLSALAAVTNSGAPGGGDSIEGAPNYISSRVYGYRFNAGSLNGNYTEVGVGWSSTQLFSRALIVDGGGSPTTISVSSTQFLDVFYQIRQIPNLSDTTTSITIGGVSYSMLRRPAYVSSNSWWRPISGETRWANGGVGATNNVYTGTIGAVTGAPSGTSSTVNASSTTLNAYSNNSYERTGTITLGLDNWNLSGGIKSMFIASDTNAYQFEFTPVIPKDATKTMTINGKITWGRL